MTRAAALVATWALLGADAVAVTVTGVRHHPPIIDPAKNESVTVRFRLDEPARVGLHVYDGRDLEVRRIEGGRLAAGDHALRWDGRDAAGRPVPPEAYVYTLAAVGGGGEPVLWDLTDRSAGRTQQVKSARWDPTAGAFIYTLAEPSRVRIRVGLANQGPLLRTVIDWVTRGKGRQVESWDGMDASGVLDLSEHPSLEILAQAFALPRNAVVVGPASDRVQLIADLPRDAARRARRLPASKRMFDYAHQPIETRRDYPLRMELPKNLPRNVDGLPVVTGPVPVRIALEEGDLMRVLEERAEAVFYLDGRFVFENEVGFLPMTWTWHPHGANPGRHVLTANVRGYEGHFGIATVEVFVGRQERTRP